MAVIYAVTCVVNGFAYVGCTRADNVKRRWREHRSALNRGLHTSTRMLADWQRFGDAGFCVAVAEVLPDNADLAVRREAELRWMGAYQSQDRLYNAQVVSFGPSGNFKEKTGTPEARRKRSLALRGKPKPPGHGAKISATKKRLGQRPSLEAARMGGIAACKIRWSKIDEIV